MAENRVLWKTRRAPPGSIRAPKLKSRPNGFSTITRAFLARSAAPNPLITVSKSAGGNCQIVRRAPRLPQRCFDRRECIAVCIVSAHVLSRETKGV